MNSSAIVALLILGTFVWGGLASILVVAYRREAEKRRVAAAAAPTVDTSHRNLES